MFVFMFLALRQDGPAVYVHEAGTMTFNGFATFAENVAYDVSALGTYYGTSTLYESSRHVLCLPCAFHVLTASVRVFCGCHDGCWG